MQPRHLAAPLLLPSGCLPADGLASSTHPQPASPLLFTSLQVGKRYLAVVWGRLQGRGWVYYELDGRPCSTEYHAVSQSPVDLASLLEQPQSTAAEKPAAKAAGGAGGQAGAAALEVSSATDGTAAAAVAGAASTRAAAEGQEDTAWVTLVDLVPHTGRTHQLRRHMALLGHPLVGDRKYTYGYAAQREQAGFALLPELHVQSSCRASPREGISVGGGLDASSDGEGSSPGSTGEPSNSSGGSAWREWDASPAAAGALARRGSPPICLWAVQLDLVHPVSGEPLHFEIPHPPSYAQLLCDLAGGRHAGGPVQKTSVKA